MSYSVFAYTRMFTDKVRLATYTAALRQTVRPGDVVLDLGAGTGIFSFLACEFGARRVIAIEPNNAIQTARAIAAANGLEDRIEFVQDVSTSVTLPEKANVVISDLRGILPQHQRHIQSIMDARTRFLAPGGTLIPVRDTLRVAVVQAPELHRRYVERWKDSEFAFDMKALRQMLVNTWHNDYVSPESILLEPQVWAKIDYESVATTDTKGTVTWTVDREGTAHGLVMWFDSMLADGVYLSNAPGKDKLIYGHAYFPLEAPLRLVRGDSLSLHIHANFVNDEYFWRWETLQLDAGNSSQVKAHFKQSTLFGLPLSMERMREQSADHVPVLNVNGEINKFILHQMNGMQSNDDIARSLLACFPKQFATRQAALLKIRDIWAGNCL